jgi:hypothetical protein
LQDAEQRLRTKLNDVQEASAATNEARTCADALRALLVQAAHTLQDAEAIPNAYRTLAADIGQTLPTAEAQLAALRDLHVRSPPPTLRLDNAILNSAGRPGSSSCWSATLPLCSWMRSADRSSR